MLKIGFLGLIAAGAGFLGGYAASTRSHGDWLLMRDGSGNCVAFDPGSREEVGTWSIGGGARCHMSDFVWRQVIDKPLKMAQEWAHGRPVE